MVDRHVLTPPWLAHLLPAPPATSLASPVIFPSTDLAIRVYVALGADPSGDPAEWAWADITSFVRYVPAMVRTWGRKDPISRVQSATLALTLDNADGRFTRTNPNGEYFGLLTRNTPIWVQVDPGSGFQTWYQGFVNEWPTRWPSLSGAACFVPIKASGQLRRLVADGDVRSCPRRTLTAAIAGDAIPDLYLPLEDGSDTAPEDVFVHTGDKPLIYAITYGPAQAGASAASLPFAMFDISPREGEPTPGLYRIRGRVNASGSGTYLKVAFVFQGQMASTPAPVMAVVDLTRASGTSLTVSMLAGWDSTTEEFGSTGVAATGLGLDSSSTNPEINPFDGKAHWIEVIATQNGSDIDSTMYVDGVLAASATMAATTLSTPIIWQFRPGAGSIDSTPVDNTGASAGIGHLAIYAGTVAPTQNDAGTGFTGEQAHARLARLCSENSIQSLVGASESANMGPQRPATLSALLDEITEVDGVVYEAGFGLGHLSNSERWNSTSWMIVDFDAAQFAGLPDPDDDDRGLLNRYTASRPEGAEYTYEETTGTLGTATVGAYTSAGSHNVAEDGQLGDQAAWRVRRGTVDEVRWSRVPLDFSRSPELVVDYLGMPFGARITLTNPPTPMPPQDVEMVVEGGTDRITPKKFTAVLYTSPWAPYDVRRLAGDSGDTDGVGWWTPDSFALNTAVDASETSWLIDVDPVASTDSDDYPCDIWVLDGAGARGEQVRITAVSGASAPQTATVTRSVNGVTKTHAAGAELELAHPLVWTYGAVEE